MFRAILAIFAWEVVRDTGATAYLRNRITGSRRAWKYVEGGHQPVDCGWIETGRWSEPGRPPTGGSALRGA